MFMRCGECCGGIGPGVPGVGGREVSRLTDGERVRARYELGDETPESPLETSRGGKGGNEDCIGEKRPAACWKRF